MLRIEEGPRADSSEEASIPGPARSPGRRARHYAPSKPLRLVDPSWDASDRRAGEVLLRLPEDPARAAETLYAELRRLEADERVERIVVVAPPDDAAWRAIRDRLKRASSD